MDQMRSDYQFSEDINMKNSNNQPRLFRPERFEYNERTDLPQTETYVREERTVVEPSQQQRQRREQEQSSSETYVRHDRSPPQEEQVPYHERRERESPNSSNDSLINTTESQTNNEKQTFGEHYWEEPRVSAPLRRVGDSETFLAQADAPPSTVELGAGSDSNVSQRPSRLLGQYFGDLIQWRNIKDSVVAFIGGLLLLFALSYFSIITVFAYSSLAILLLASGFVFLKQLIYTFQQKQGVHPFQSLLNREVIIRPEYAHQQLENILQPINGALINLRNLYLADSLAQTLKLALFMYILAYIGSWFNLLTLTMLLWVMAFTLPKLYVTFKPQIDGFSGMIAKHVRDVQIRISGIFNQQRNKFAVKRRVSSQAGPAQLQTEKKVTFTHTEKIE